MKVIVTGGTGMVGKSLKNINKFFNDNTKENDTYSFYYLSSSDCNLIDYDETFEVFSSIKPEIVVHLAANVGGLYKNLNNNIKMFHENLQMNLNVFEICKILNVKKLITVGSTCIFPDKTKYPITCDMMHNGKPHYSNYGYSFAKRMLDVLTDLYNQNTNMRCIYLIPSNLYGPFDNFNLNNSHVIPALIHKFYLSNKYDMEVIIKGTGKAKRQFLYVDDFTYVINKIIRNNYDFTKMIVSHPKEYSIKNTINIIKNISENKNKIIYLKYYGNGQIKKTACSKKFYKYFPNYKFYDLEEGLKNTYNWFSNNYENVRK